MFCKKTDAARRAAGLCYRCGKPLDCGRTRCRECLSKRKAVSESKGKRSLRTRADMELELAEYDSEVAHLALLRMLMCPRLMRRYAGYRF